MLESSVRVDHLGTFPAYHGAVERASKRAAEAAAKTGLEAARAAVEVPTGRGAGTADPLIGDLRRAGLLPLLVLHFASREPAYGNQLIERISALTGGALSVNPNTMYPLLRSLEGQGLVAGEWEHPERRSRRFYRVTEAGEEERRRLVAELAPRLDRIATSIESIRAELL
jgi:DNA-binding PadR family transcriptional regulator